MKQESFNQENQQLGQILTAFLKSKTSETVAAADSHLDEDSMSAFVDGTLTGRESESVMKHLIACSPCRKVTAQLARLVEEFNEELDTTPVLTKQTGRLQQFFQSLGLPGLNLSDEAVFAHQDSDKENEMKDQASEDTKTDAPESNKN